MDAAIKSGGADEPCGADAALGQVARIATAESLLRAIVNSLGDRYYGLEALAIASLRERGDHTTWVEALPTSPSFATTPEQKLATARSWIRCWGRAGLWMSQMPPAWQLEPAVPGALRQVRRDGSVHRGQARANVLQ